MASHGHPGRAVPGQDALFSVSEIRQPPSTRAVPPGRADPPDLASYDILLANISGGKGSQTMVRQLVHAAEAAGVPGRIVCVFADLGADDDWPGTPELAAQRLSIAERELAVLQLRAWGLTYAGDQPADRVQLGHRLRNLQTAGCDSAADARRRLAERRAA